MIIFCSNFVELLKGLKLDLDLSYTWYSKTVRCEYRLWCDFLVDSDRRLSCIHYSSWHPHKITWNRRNEVVYHPMVRLNTQLVPSYTTIRGILTHDTRIICSVEKPKTIQHRFTIDLRLGTSHQRNLNGWKSPHGILHGSKWVMFHGLPNTALYPSKRGGSSAK